MRTIILEAIDKSLHKQAQSKKQRHETIKVMQKMKDD